MAKSFHFPFLYLFAGFLIMGHARDRDHVQRTAQAPVATAVEPMPGGIPR